MYSEQENYNNLRKAKGGFVNDKQNKSWNC